MDRTGGDTIAKDETTKHRVAFKNVMSILIKGMAKASMHRIMDYTWHGFIPLDSRVDFSSPRDYFILW